MARPLRIVVEGGVYHVTARGNERRRIYRSDADRGMFLELLGELQERFGTEIGGYVLMDNHYHLMIRLQKPLLSRAVQWLNVTYGMRHNSKYRRSGHLFQGRFHSQLVEESAIWEVMRYLHLNPARIAGLKLGKNHRRLLKSGQQPAVKEEIGRWLQAIRSPWSSYRQSIGIGKKAEWLRDEWWLESSGARKAYRTYVESGVRYGVEECPWEKVRGQAILGSEAFFNKMKDLAKGDRREQRGLKTWERRELLTLDQVRDRVERVTGLLAKNWLRKWGSTERSLYLLAGRQLAGARLIELARETGLDYASVSQATGRLRKKLETDRHLRKQWENILSIS
jgi:putative transposase